VRVVVTGGAGFIGSAVVRALVRHHPKAQVWVHDALTYAGNVTNLETVWGRVHFVQGDVRDPARVDQLLSTSHPDAVLHLAAESHVDRSIEDAHVFLTTNVIGTQVLLDAARRHAVQRFVHVSTDEVYGDVPAPRRSRPTDQLASRSPYAASNAAADHLVLVTLAVPVAAKNVTCTVYCPPPPAPLPPQAVQTNPAANNGALNGAIHSGQHPGASVQGFFANPLRRSHPPVGPTPPDLTSHPRSPGLAKQLVDDAKAGADVNVKLADTPANRKLADEIARAGGHVTLVKAAPTVSVAVVGKTGYLSTNLGVGVAITGQNTLAALQNVLSKAGSPKFGGVHRNGVFTAPGAAFYIDQVLKTASKTLVLETGDRPELPRAHALRTGGRRVTGSGAKDLGSAIQRQA
jgi:NAD(P)-dependent dehydrogenase (short-subunit alcohol dehydrogenase family)